MSKRIMFLSGALVAIVVLIGLVLGSQLYLGQPSQLRASIANAQPSDHNSVGALLTSPQQQATATPAQSGTISVSGIGRATAAPDIARMTIGVESVGPNVGTVVSDVNTKQAAIIAKLKALGVAEKDIQTTAFNVSIDRSKPPTSGSPEGPLTYHAVNTAQITIRKTEQLSAILEAAVQAGANNIYGVNLSLADSTPLQSEARSKAVADAKAKAEALAKAAGLKLGRAVSISEGAVPGFPQPVFAADARSAGGAFETGELQVNVQVQVVFASEPQ